MLPIHASFNQSRPVLGNGRRRAITIAQRIADARRKRIPANVNGGRSRNPSLMKSQVEPHIRQSASQTMRGVFIVEECRTPIFSLSDKGRADNRRCRLRSAMTNAL